MYFSSLEIKWAETERRLQQEIGWPSTASFNPSFPTTTLRLIWSTLTTSTELNWFLAHRHCYYKEKWQGLGQPRIKSKKIPLPLPISKHHKNIELYIDFFFINGYTFLHTKSRKVNLLTADICTSRSKSQIINTLETIRQTYDVRGSTSLQYMETTSSISMHLKHQCYLQFYTYTGRINM